MRRAANQAAAVDDWALAIEEMFRSIARGLAERTILTTSPGTTAREFSARAGALFPSLSAALASTAAVFDEVRYLDGLGTEAAYRRAAELEAELRSIRSPWRPRAAADDRDTNDGGTDHADDSSGHPAVVVLDSRRGLPRAGRDPRDRPHRVGPLPGYRVLGHESRADRQHGRRRGAAAAGGWTCGWPARSARRSPPLVGRPDSTLFLYDSGDFLDEARLTEIAGLARDVVVLTPGFAQLRAVAPEVAQAGTVNRKVLRSDCTLPAVAKADSVNGAGRGYRVTGKDTVATRCLGSGSRAFSLIRLERGPHTITVLGTMDALSNEHVAERGNAALALNLLGANQRLVWYLPTIDDSAAAGAPSIAELTPVWVSSVMALLVIVAIVAAFWRGRRMGPLVVENLPVTVRASETMEGRARLYQRGGARLRALDSLRVGTIARVAAQCGLPRLAPVDEVIAAASAVTGADPRQLRSLLLDETPRTDRELVRLSPIRRII